MYPLKIAVALAGIGLGVSVQADDISALNPMQPQDVFEIEYASGLQVSPDGERVYFARNFMDIQSDRKLSNLWSVEVDDKSLRPITSGLHADYGAALSPNGKKLAFVSNQSGSSQIHMHWLDTGHSAKLTNLTSSPRNLQWSPDGKYIAFQMFVKQAAKAPVSLPGKPEGAKWADAPRYIDDVYYRNDGAGYATPGTTEIFLLSADGGTPRQLTDDEFDNSGAVSWAADGSALYYSANRHENGDLDPINSEIYRLTLDSLSIEAITERKGPDRQPKVSPDGKKLAYVGYDDKLTNYENALLYVRDIASGKTTRYLTDLDRSVGQIAWAANSKGLYAGYDDQGQTKLVYQPLKGKRRALTDAMGGLSYGRPYSGAEFAIGANDQIAFTYSKTDRPADVAVLKKGKVSQLTALNEDAFAHKDLAKVEALWYKSSADGLDIQSWVAYPPGFDPSKKYPLILEIHGGPVANYGPHFSAEVQLYAAKGYVVLYVNPRGSDSYGVDFAQKIHLNYPSQDYDDLISGVDTLIDKGFIDQDKLFVTGGSGGGVLTAWIVSHTDRFRAAVVAKPVINWYSFVLTADFYPFFYKYWFGAKPWEDLENYMRRSPIHHVGNVKTPTMLLTGEADYRTPISETEQFYQALKLQQVETAMVRIPDAPHGIYRRPSNLMAKTEYILWWFEKYQNDDNQAE